MSPDHEAHTMLSPDAIAETYWQLHSQNRLDAGVGSAACCRTLLIETFDQD